MANAKTPDKADEKPKDEPPAADKAEAPAPAAPERPVPAGTNPADAEANRKREADAAKGAATARQYDNTAAREDRGYRPPSAKEVDALRKREFGDKPGGIHLDTDVGTGKTTLVYIGGDGKELRRETFRPESPKAEGK